MDKIIEIVFMKLISIFGYTGGIIFIIILFALGYIFITLFKDWFDKFKSKFENRKHINLIQHQVFKELDYLINHKLKNINTKCVIRKKLYVDIMTERIKCVKEAFLKLCKDPQLNKLQPRQFHNKIKGAVDDSNELAIQLALANGVPSFVLNSMIQKRDIVMQFYYNSIKSCCFNQYIYDNNKDRMCAILELVLVSVECYMNILQQNLAQFNGGIKGLNYKGITCINCPSCIHDEYLKSIKQEIKNDISKTNIALKYPDEK